MNGITSLTTYTVASVDIAHLIQVALTPIFLISAIGVTLNVLTSRLARIVDRARARCLEERRTCTDRRFVIRARRLIRDAGEHRTGR